MDVQVEAFAFYVFFHTQAAADDTDYFQKDEAHHAAVHHGGQRIFQLDEYLRAYGSVAAEDLVAEEHAGEHGTDQAAEAVDTEGIERIIIIEFAFQHHRGEVAADGGEDTDGQRALRADETGCRGDAYQAGYGTGSQAEG